VGDPDKNMKGMTVPEMLVPWTTAFGDGPDGCPDLQVNAHKQQRWAAGVE